jgi:hypothetical protein
MNKKHLFFIPILIFCFLFPLGNFVVKALVLTDSDSVVVSAEVGATTGTTGTTTGTTTTSGGSGGGGGGYIPPVPESIPSTIDFSGYAYPRAQVYLLENGVEKLRVKANADASFSMRIFDTLPGTHMFAVVAEDKVGRRSILFPVPISVATGTTTSIRRIFLPPVIKLSSVEFGQKDALYLEGSTVPNAALFVAIHGPVERTISTTVGDDGTFSTSTSLVSFKGGRYTLEAKATHPITGELSVFGKLLSFFVRVGSKNNQPYVEPDDRLTADLNGDGKVTLADFSILSYWYKKPNPPAYVDLNGDGKITLTDFSILAYQWNG